MIDKFFHGFINSVYDFNDFTLNELICKLAQKMDEVITQANESFNYLEWLKEQGLSDEVIKLMLEWKENGTLETLINDVLLQDINEKVDAYKTEVDTFKTKVNEQLDTIKTKQIDYVNVESFGAKGDGITDDTEAIKQALQSGYNIAFSKKTYCYNAPIKITTNNVIIDGCGAKLKCLNGVSTTELTPVVGSIEVSGDNITFKNFEIDVDGEWIVRPFTWQVGYIDYVTLRKKHYVNLIFRNCNNLNVTNLTCKNGLNSMQLQYVKNFTVEKINIYKMMGDGIFITDGCSYGLVRDCYAEECNDDCYACDGYSLDTTIQPHDVTFDNCNSYNCVASLVCLEGSYNTKFINGTGKEIKHKPFKTGLLQVNSKILAYGNNQLIENCKFSISETVQGDSNGNSESFSCGIESGDKITLRNIEIIKPQSSKTYEITLQGTNYVLDNVKIENVGFCLKKVQGFKIVNSTFNLNDSFYIIQSTSVDIRDCTIYNKSLSTLRGATPIIYSGLNDCSLKRSNLSSDGSYTYLIELQGNAPTYKGFKTDIQSLTCSGGFEGLYIDSIYLAGTIADARFADGQLVYDQYGYGIKK